jgi:methionyl-tRNA formyltransferase
MKIVFLGSGAFGLPTLRRLVAEHTVSLVVTQPDRSAGRGRKLTPTAVALFAAEHGVETIRTPDINDEQTADRIRAAGGDALVVIAFGQKIAPVVLDEAFAINLHASLLPKYRGAAPINWAVINGEAETGVSVITITQRMDAGDVLAQRSTPIDPMETAEELSDRLAALGPEIIMETLDHHMAGRLRPAPQDDRLATRAPKLSKADGTVRFDQPPTAVQHRVHGLTPWPGCAVLIGGERLKLLRVETTATGEVTANPGLVLEDGTIACAGGSVRLLEVQPPGGKPMSFEAFRRGRDVPPGCRMEPL